jgi:hypothetical protein
MIADWFKLCSSERRNVSPDYSQDGIDVGRFDRMAGERGAWVDGSHRSIVENKNLAGIATAGRCVLLVGANGPC